ncbi:MAG: cation:proton antiporter [Burkholderiales bacterium]|nr:cation:proton antiporter [Burkholderiales bacterium]MBP9769620.1 cation:proton antiporter [Burkholderiales bacterium]
MNVYILMMILSLLLIGSFLFNFLLNKYQISPVLLLIFTGVILKFAATSFNVGSVLSPQILSIFGSLGLITIVLEAVLDLQIHRGNRKELCLSFILAVFIVIISALLIGVIIKYVYTLSLWDALIYATPLSIVSSAIVIPSVAKLAPKLKDFLVFESIFSDIIGILLFNFLVMVEFSHISSFWLFWGYFFLMLGLSFAISIPLAFLINHKRNHHQHIFILAVLILIYSIAKYFHFSALILILIFGLTLSNLKLFFSKTFFEKMFHHDSLQNELNDMRKLTSELAFIIRTLFFVLFGYSLNLSLLLDFRVLLVGCLVIVVMYAIRYISFLPFSRDNIYEKVFIAPRGLITVLLFYQIPDNFINNKFDTGIIFFVVIFSSIFMSGKLIMSGRNLLKN